ncbi:hypothetical protein IJH89_01360 [Candidatus Saccharibacteria bacterium]|nr:hypothetical protein [Candidatus Saccharibacteria bacterium]
MSGTRTGGLKAREMILLKYSKDFYHRLGTMGKGKGAGGFTKNPQLAKIVGAIGRRKSRRGPAKNKR